MYVFVFVCVCMCAWIVCIFSIEHIYLHALAHAPLDQDRMRNRTNAKKIAKHHYHKMYKLNVIIYIRRKYV